VFSPIIKPIDIIFITASPTKNIEMIVVMLLIVSSKYASSIAGEFMMSSNEFSAIRWYMKSSK
jgi:hypothetical protein